jgi:uncharacterized membrane protein
LLKYREDLAKLRIVNTTLTNINSRQRIQSIDLLRGAIMIVMALDHTRDFISYGNSIDQDPLDFGTTTPILFLTRWITHFCAPTFVFLSGTSIFLNSLKGKTKNQLCVFLITRGVWLMLIDMFLIQLLWDFVFDAFFLQVIWAIGLCMVLLAFLQYLPYRILIAIGLVIVFGHNLLDGITVDSPYWKSLLWSIVHVRREFPVNPHFFIMVAYPFLPWLGVMILGYAAGKLYTPSFSAAKRQSILKITGLVCIILFVAIRWTNAYGDMQLWSKQKSTFFTILDFVKTTKYPPSLLFTLMTLGPALIFLAYAENIRGTIKNKIIVFGKVPFFYYVLHVLLIHTIAWSIFFARGHSWSELSFYHGRDGSMPYGSGYSLGIVYLIWILVIIILYFPCRWYSRYKSTHRNWWLSYI